METKHYVLLVGIVISLLLSYIAVMIHLDVTAKNYNDNALPMTIMLFLLSWILGGLVFWGIKKIFLDKN